MAFFLMLGFLTQTPKDILTKTSQKHTNLMKKR